MKRLILFAALAVFESSALFGQPASAPPAFDAASVRTHTAGSAEESRIGPWIQTSPIGVTIRNAKVLWCLAWAYDTKDWLISGPDWMDSERYDIVAKMAGPVPVAQLKLMLQTLLVDRFKLALHHETKELPVTALVLAKKGPINLQPAAAGGRPDGPRIAGSGKEIHNLVYKTVSMRDFAERLGGPPPLGVGETVVDGTGIKGAFDITLKVDTENFLGGREEFADYLKTALDEQFGLKLERRKAPFDTLVVDRGNKIPAGN